MQYRNLLISNGGVAEPIDGESDEWVRPMLLSAMPGGFAAAVVSAPFGF